MEARGPSLRTCDRLAGTLSSVAKTVHLPEEVLRRQRRLNGLPQADERAFVPGRWWTRILTHRLLWWTLLALWMAGATLLYQHFLISGIGYERTFANLMIGISFGLMAALVPLALSRVAINRFRLRDKEAYAMVGGWTAWLAVLAFVGVAIARQLKVREMPGGWAPTGMLTLGVAAAIVVTMALAALSLFWLRSRELGNGGKNWARVVLGVAVAGALAAIGWFVGAQFVMPHLPAMQLPEGAMLPTREMLEEATLKGLGKAWPTMLVYVAIFTILVDRRRPSGWLPWLFALAWGVGMSTMLSITVNSWAGELLGNAQAESAGANARTAVYIAPFVEEAAKASVLFFLAALYRERLTTKLNLVALGGLSAVGFAFTENIIYFMRAVLQVSSDITTGNGDEALNQLAFLRGVLTSWGHPLFTAATAFGLALGMRQRSRLARILYPLAGYVVAAGEHMFFNLQASSARSQEDTVKFFGIFGGMAVLTLLSFTFTNWIREGRLVRARLTDYERMGWLQADDPKTFSSGIKRIALVLLSLLVGLRRCWATIRLIRAMVQLAYLRDSMTRGLVDAGGGLQREKELLFTIRELRPVALTTTKDWTELPFFWKRLWTRFSRRGAHQPAQYPGPAGLGGNWPTAGQGLAAAAAHGGTQYSAVDPNWAPPS